MILRPRLEAVGLEQGQGLDQRLRAHLRQMLGQLAARDLRVDVVGDLMEDGARVEPRVHQHDGDAGRVDAVQDGPLDGSRTAQLGEERGMHVDHAAARHREQVGLEDVPVGDHDTHVGGQRADPRDEIGVGGPRRLEHRHALGLCRQFHGRRYGRRARAPLRLVGPRDRRDDVEALAQ